MIDLRYVKKLLDMLDGSTVDSIEISSDKGMKIRISKTPAQRGAVQVAAPMAMPPALLSAAPAQLGAGGRTTPAEGMPAVGEGGDGRGSGGGAGADSGKSKLLEVKSPMVGTFYASPEPGAPPYVSVGSRVAKGQVLCIIEAMKIMNEIESEFAGVVREVLASDAHPVEYGQVLFRVDPNG